MLIRRGAENSREAILKNRSAAALHFCRGAAGHKVRDIIGHGKEMEVDLTPSLRDSCTRSVRRGLTDFSN